MRSPFWASGFGASAPGDSGPSRAEGAGRAGHKCEQEREREKEGEAKIWLAAAWGTSWG